MKTIHPVPQFGIFRFCALIGCGLKSVILNEVEAKMDNLTFNLDQMIYHQRLAEQSYGDEQDHHHREAMRYRLMAAKLDKQGRVIRQLIGPWLNLN